MHHRYLVQVTALVLIGALTALPQGGLKLVIVEGDGAINNIQQRVAREPIVQVTDEDDRPVAGAVVAFTLPERGASATFADGSRLFTTTTDANGRAIARGLMPNSVTGNFEMVVTASYQGKTASGRIRMTNVAKVAAAGAGSGKLILILAIVGGAVAGGVAAAAGGGGGSSPAPSSPPVSPPATSIVITPGTGSVGPPR